MPEHSKHIVEKDLELYLKAQLSSESIAALDVHLAGCDDCVNRLAEQDKCLWYLAELTSGEVADEDEKRSYPRIVTDEAALLQLINPFSVDTWNVRIVNVSKGGLRTYTPNSLMQGSLVKIKMRYSVAFGDVRYCIPADNGFYAGVRLHDYFAR